MRLHAVDIPDDPAELPAWLERHLVGPHLAELVAELAAVQGAAGEAPSLEGVLGERRELVLARGLAVLPPDVLRQFLLRPRLLLGLQELVLVEGGPYWSRFSQAPTGVDDPVRRGRGRLDAFLAAEDRVHRAERQVVPLRVAWYRQPWLVGLASAAAVLVAVAVYLRYGPPGRQPVVTGPTAREEELERQLADERQQRQLAEQRVEQQARGQGWGWSRPGALPENVTAAAYLNALADGAREWFNQRPDEPAALAKRLLEFRQGCDTLIFAGHRPLPAGEREWLVRKCRQWAARLDRHLEALEAGQDVREVRTEVDRTINELIASLRARAEDAAG